MVSMIELLVEAASTALLVFYSSLPLHTQFSGQNWGIIPLFNSYDVTNVTANTTMLDNVNDVAISNVT